MELAVFTSIVGVIKELLGLADAFSQADERNRERVAAWLQQLGELIQDIADKIELNDYPHNTCAQMEIMVDHFPLTHTSTSIRDCSLFFSVKSSFLN